MTGREIREFNAYLRTLTNTQVLGVLAKERAASPSRDGYVALAEAEAERRGMDPIVE